MNTKRPDKRKWSVDSGRWTVSGVQGSGFRVRESRIENLNSSPILHPSSFILHPSSFFPRPSPLAPRPSRIHPSSFVPHHSLFCIHHSAFSLVELLVTIAIIAILAGISLGALRWARSAAAEAKTKATIAKLNDIIMQQYESYMTRRVPITIPPNTNPKDAARMRLDAIRDLMRMEMPERWTDIEKDKTNIDVNEVPYTFNYVINGNPISRKIDPPALLRMYFARVKSGAGPDPSGVPPGYGPAECLYMIVSMAHPQAMEQFSQSEIGDTDGDGYPEFIDGWGMPIMFLRWAPGFSYRTDRGFNGSSEIQSGDPVSDHDPFDTRKVDSGAFRLIPLIYSAGPDKKYGINISNDFVFNGDPYQVPTNGVNVGEPVDEEGMTNTHEDNIHNHHLEQQ